MSPQLVRVGIVIAELSGDAKRETVSQPEPKAGKNTVRGRA